jgi:phosphate transport system protein
MILDQNVLSIEKECLEMCSYAEENMKRAMAFYHSEPEEPFAPIDDDVVDKYERSLEERCLDFLMRERPYAGDMREVSGILKLIEDIERIGDHAEDVVEWSHHLHESGLFSSNKMDTMAEVALGMVHSSFLALSRKDDGMALEVEKEDDYQDQLYEETIQELIQDGEKKQASPAAIVYGAIVAKYFERISDHAVNVAEWVIYIMKGYHKDKQIF